MQFDLHCARRTEAPERSGYLDQRTGRCRYSIEQEATQYHDQAARARWCTCSAVSSAISSRVLLTYSDLLSQLSVTHTVPLTQIDQEEIRAVCSEYRLTSATISIHEPDCTIDQVLDVLEGNRVYIPAVFVLNKIDAISIEGASQS
jgi:hypothetical protein